MDWSKVGKILRSACHRDDDAAVLSRRDALAGLGLAGLFLAAGPKLLTPAEAKPVDATAIAEATSTDANKVVEATEPGTPERDAADKADTTDLSAHRWRRRYWRRRWRRRYWRRRYWRRRHWRRRYWRRRYWRRRRYWY